MGRCLASIAIFLFAIAPLARAQDGNPRDVEQNTIEPQFHSKVANAAVPLTLMLKNEGGIDQAGLCVIASIRCGLKYQGREDIAEWLWARAKERDGGYFPSKLEGLLNEAKEKFPELSWKQHTSAETGEEFLHRWNAEGYPIGITYGTGRPYGMRPIAHMVLLIHADQQFACIIDNNPIYKAEGSPNPGFAYTWMPWPELWRRHCMMGGPWGVVFTSPSSPTEPLGWTYADSQMVALALGIVFVWLAVMSRVRPAA